MFDIHKVQLDWGGRPLTLETGKVARQADGAVIATYGETTVIATVVAAKQPKAGVDFLPLTVNYTEKYYAAGRIPGGYFKRERGPTEKDTLTSRLIDRPIRPLFAEGWRCDTQVIITVLSHDQENDPDIVAMVAASAALTLSGSPFMGPIGGARVGFINNEYVLNPSIDEMKETQLDLVVAGTQDAVLMVESEAKELSEEIMLGAVMFGHRHLQPVIEAIIKLAEKAAKEPREFALPDTAAIEKEMLGIVEQDLRKAYAIPAKHERQDAVGAVKKRAMAHFFPDGKDNPDRPMTQVAGVFKDLEAKIVRWNILDTSKRIDGRDLVTVRPIDVEAGFLPRTHGSALFTRGETQAIVVATLGTSEDEQFIDALQGTYKETFLLHYNFPPFSVGETGRIGAPGRREIGHGKLAWRAIRPMLPAKEEFPYTIRVVSEITESNGSSSMATVCGTSLALMDAGVPLKRPTAGIAMGLILEDKRYAVLSDILGDEDHLGDMDFKVAGTDRGRHRAADGHQDRRHYRRDHEGRADPGQGRPHAYPRRNEQSARQGARGARRVRTAHRDLQDPHRQDPRSDRHRRQGDPRDRREDRRQDQCRGRRHREGGLGRRRVDQGGGQLDQVDRVGSGSRSHLRRHRGQGHGLRRLREFLRRQGRSRAHQPARGAPRAEDHPMSSRKATR